MLRLIGAMTLVGAVIGLVFIGAECWTLQRELSGVVIGAGYEPMVGVEFSTGYSLSPALSELLNEAARPSGWWTWSALPWWSYPVIGGLSGAVLGVPLALIGMRLTR